MRGTVIGKYLAALADGDPYAVGLTIAFAVFGAVLGLAVWVIKARTDADDRRHKERLRQKRGY